MMRLFHCVRLQAECVSETSVCVFRLTRPSVSEMCRGNHCNGKQVQTLVPLTRNPKSKLQLQI